MRNSSNAAAQQFVLSCSNFISSPPGEEITSAPFRRSGRGAGRADSPDRRHARPTRRPGGRSCSGMPAPYSRAGAQPAAQVRNKHLGQPCQEHSCLFLRDSASHRKMFTTNTIQLPAGLEIPSTCPSHRKLVCKLVLKIKQGETL